MDKTVQEFYGNRVRVRVCGLCWRNEDLLVINHHGLYGHDFWAPPGGGVDFGESLADGLKREFSEETGLAVEILEQRFVCEFIKAPLHAVEVFFDVAYLGGQILAGKDPEMEKAVQIIQSVKFISMAELENLPDSHKHGIFRVAPSGRKLKALAGYFRI
ncbi:MAG TPA: NUDIX hydrolase [Cyclobacteriaceae bacterium]|nr:NUDIX hydrolase [Cyclobacteriaceae bacterium]